MAKNKIEPIVIEDEMPLRVSHEAPLSEDLTAAVTAQAAQKAPTMDEVLAYWTPGREVTMEVPALIEEYSVACTSCEAMTPYIPEAGKPAPALICAACAK